MGAPSSGGIAFICRIKIDVNWKITMLGTMRCYLVTLFFVVLTANIAQASECKLLPDECNTIEVFERTSTSVVYIESLAVRRRIFSMDVFEVPQGTGSGFIWDKKGHVVTNFHVIQGSSSFKVTLHNQKSFDAVKIWLCSRSSLKG